MSIEQISDIEVGRYMTRKTEELRERTGMQYGSLTVTSTNLGGHLSLKWHGYVSTGDGRTGGESVDGISTAEIMAKLEKTHAPAVRAQMLRDRAAELTRQADELAALAD
jgi:hypothetical protein